MAKITPVNFKREMIKKAEKKGSTWENFGQKELEKLKEKYGYDIYSQNSIDRKYVLLFDSLDYWAQNFCFKGDVF